MKHSISIHFRCSDNINPISTGMGLIPFSRYISILSNITKSKEARMRVNKVIIFTDAELQRSNGNVCSRLVGELGQRIRSLPVYSNLPVVVQWNSVDETYASLHLAAYTICGVSSLCMFASFGSKNPFIPFGDNVGMKLPVYSNRFRAKFYEVHLLQMTTDNQESFFQQVTSS